MTSMARDNSRGCTVIMVRHCATTWNEAGRYQGRADPSLSDAGRLAAAALAERLAGIPLSLVVASPLRRAAETAQAIAQRHGLRVQFNPALVEIDYGAWEGLTQPEVRQRWPDLLRHWKRAPGTVRFPRGESLAQARTRLRSVVFQLSASLDPGATVAVITHQTMIRLALLEATGEPVEAFRAHPAETATFHHFTLSHNRLRAVWPSHAERSDPGTVQGETLGASVTSGHEAVAH